MSTSLTTTTPTAPVIDQAAVLRALRLDPKDPNTQALVLTCGRYGLDPLLKHAVLIQGTLYVTRDGLMHVAHASGRFDGISVRSLPETPTHYIAEATVWRKDMGHPFVYTGRYPKGGKGGPGAQYGPEMAEKCAECRALRRAFSVALCSREELFDQEDAPAPAAIAASPAQIEAPKPKPINVAIRDFWQAADAKGFAIRGEDGKVSNEMVQALATRVRGGVIPETGADWDAAREALDYPPVDIVEINTDDIGDPFAEDGEPALLSVPADPTPEPVAASPFVDQPKGRR